MAETQKLPKSLYGVVVVRNKAGDTRLIGRITLEDTLYSAEDAAYDEDLDDDGEDEEDDDGEDEEDDDDESFEVKKRPGVKNGKVFVIGEYKLVKTLRVNRRVETKIVTNTMGAIQVSEVSGSRRVNFDDESEEPSPRKRRRPR